MKENILLSQQLSLSGEATLSQQLEQIVRTALENGELSPGDSIPAEAAFCEAYHISRSTVRKALNTLTEEGLLSRVRGKGTFVSGDKLSRRVQNVYGFSYEMEAAGRKPSSKLLAFLKGAAPRDVAATLFGNPDAPDEVFTIIRLRSVDTIPLILETAYIPVHFAPGLTEERLGNRSLYDVLQELSGILPTRSEESYESCMIERSLCSILGCAKGTLGFAIERVTYMQGDQVFEVMQGTMRADRARLVVSLNQNNCYMKRSVDDDTIK